MSGYVPERLIGPIQVSAMPGRGRGVVATEAIAAGQLLLVTHPLAVVYSNGTWQPYLETLAKRLAAMQLSDSQQLWLDTLFNGMPKSTRRIPDLSIPSTTQPLPPHPEQPDGCAPTPASTSASASSTPTSNASTSAGAGAASTASTSTSAAAPATTAAGDGSGSAPAALRSSRKKAGAAGGQQRPAQQQKQEQKRVRQLEQVVNYNAYGEKHEDMAAGVLRGEAPRGMLGLWPEFSMFNHSCAPNAINLTLGGSMVVRAVRPIAAGQEVTISYLGRPQLLPLDARRDHLRSSHGFSCTCPRCEGEAARWDQVGPLCEAAHELATGELQNSALQAVVEGDVEELREAQWLLRASVQRVHGMFRKAYVSPQVRRWCHASMYHCLELLEDVEACLGEDTSWVTKLCLEAMAEVSPGSDLHAILAARHWQQQRQPRQGAQARGPGVQQGLGQESPEQQQYLEQKEEQQERQQRHGEKLREQQRLGAPGGEQGGWEGKQRTVARDGAGGGSAGPGVQGGQAHAAEAAFRVCAAAHRLRYGDVSDRVLQQLVEQNLELCGTWNRALLSAM